jgi:hypothetical protein
MPKLQSVWLLTISCRLRFSVFCENIIILIYDFIYEF